MGGCYTGARAAKCVDGPDCQGRFGLLGLYYYFLLNSVSNV